MKFNWCLNVLNEWFRNQLLLYPCPWSNVVCTGLGSILLAVGLEILVIKVRACAFVHTFQALVFHAGTFGSCLSSLNRCVVSNEMVFGGGCLALVLIGCCSVLETLRSGEVVLVLECSGFNVWMSVGVVLSHEATFLFPFLENFRNWSSKFFASSKFGSNVKFFTSASIRFGLVTFPGF